MQFQVAEVREEILVGHPELPDEGIQRFNLHRLNHFFMLPQRRVHLAVREDQPVDTEGDVAGLVAVITAVGKIFLAVLMLAPYALVNPIPDETAAEARIGSR